MKTKDKGDVIASEQRRPIVCCFILGGDSDQTAFANNSSAFTLICLEHQRDGNYGCQKEQAIPAQ